MTANEAMIVQYDRAAHHQAELAAGCGGAAELMRPVDSAAEVVRRGRRRGRRCPRKDLHCPLCFLCRGSQYVTQSFFSIGSR